MERPALLRDESFDLDLTGSMRRTWTHYWRAPTARLAQTRLIPEPAIN
jgi:hypothetical protein